MAEPDQPLAGYPPEEHVSRDLRVVFERVGDDRHLEVDIVPELLTDCGTLDAGVAAVLIDMQAGGIALEAVAPDWIVTSDMTVHLGRPIGLEPVVGRTRTLRVGKNNVVLETSLYTDRDPSPAAIAQLGFTRILRRDDTPVIPLDGPARSSFAVEGSGFDRPVYERLGLRALNEASGHLELALTDYQRNSIGAMQGGVVVAVATRAAQALGRETLGAPVVTTDFTAHYLALARPGPLRSTCQLVRADADAAVVRVELRDAGQDDRLCTLVTATVRHFGVPG